MTVATTGPFPSVSELRAEAAEKVNSTPPGDVLLAAFFGLFTILGWLIGRAWFVSASTLLMVIAAAKYGYWNGAKVPAEQRVKKPQAQ